MKKPTFFGKYLLLERVNVGGMAEVFIAKAFGVEGFERILAIKKILPTMAEDDEFITMFIDEARISVQLNHANIVHIHELGKHEDAYFIAMEYVAGRDVRTLLERYRRRKEIMPTAQAVFIVSKMCEGLDYAHRKKDARGQDLHIIHRDVSPQNILVSYEGEVKIIDFGIAKAANRSQKTQAGILKGKFGYMSPEQVRGMPIDRRSDIFAVGVLLYEMLTGEKLFVGESDFSTLEKVRNADIPLPREFNPNISSGLEKVVLKALAREPEDRYQWASDLQEDLMRFLLAGDAIYSSKHLSGFMKEAFAEDMLREAEKMERYASVERPDQIEHSGVTVPPPAAAPPPRATAQKKSPAPSASGSPVGRASTAPAQPAPGYIPPPTAEELAEMDGAADKTQIVDSTHTFRAPETRIADSSVVVDDSITGRSENPIDRAGHHTSASPFARDDAPRGKGKSGPKSQVIIGDEGGEAYAGATMIGPAPTAPPSRGRGGSAAPVLDPEEEETTGNITLPVGSRHNGLRAQAADEEDPDGAYDDQGDEFDRGGEEDYGDEGQQDADEPPYDDEADGPATIPQKASKMAKPAPAAKVEAKAKAKPKAPAGPKKPLPKPAIIGAAVAVALLLIGGVVVMVRGSSTGSVNFIVNAMNATVLVDGEPVIANQVIELSAGLHQVTASAPGYQPVKQQVEVVAGQAATPILLGLTATAPTPKEPEPKPPEPKQPEPQVPPTTPPPVVDNTPPPTTPEPPPQKPVEPPAPKTFTAVFEGQEGAEITVNGKSLGKLPGAKLADLEIGKKYTFTAKRSGYKPFSGDFLSGGDTEVRVAVDMEAEPAPEPPKPTPPKPKPPPPVVVATPKPPPPPKPVAAAAMGKFACSTSPAGAQIWVDGKNTGRVSPVPLGNPLSLAVGKRKVVFKLNGKSTKPQVVVIEAEGVAKLINVPVN
ncbi:serine/threonine-protein kinase [Corallococcus sp. Z5C101001]|uniref:serine/threonine-protein kinase n=1 Tax=Corallococcus sp. Z5C101001 TaxID=2596829 RepID=UPI00117DC901|nr:serine/threonine-protein kinase [Corallococcus sp. Z5C101001]TSC22588.1 protein kinase [Corallococcus sp. Z5C101001]